MNFGEDAPPPFHHFSIAHKSRCPSGGPATRCFVSFRQHLADERWTHRVVGARHRNTGSVSSSSVTSITAKRLASVDRARENLGCRSTLIAFHQTGKDKTRNH
jgi:hypothetical protein